VKRRVKRIVVSGDDVCGMQRRLRLTIQSMRFVVRTRSWVGDALECRRTQEGSRQIDGNFLGSGGLLAALSQVTRTSAMTSRAARLSDSEVRAVTRTVIDRHDEFVPLLEPLLDPAYRLALHLSRNAADAEDIVQDAALLAFRHFTKFEIGTNFKAWFFRILVNRFYSRFRGAGTLATADVGHEWPLHAAHGDGGCFSRIDDPGVIVQARIESEMISAAIDRLPADFRAVCVLYLIQDLSYRDVAEFLDIPVGTVRSRLHRGRRILQVELRQLAQERGFLRDAQSLEDCDDDH
jgi:RNA polymerase sigma-70 factor, ECF subfamily